MVNRRALVASRGPSTRQTRPARSCSRPTALLCPPTRRDRDSRAGQGVRARRLRLLGLLGGGSTATGAARRPRRRRDRRRVRDRSSPADSRAATTDRLTVPCLTPRGHRSGRVRRRRRAVECAHRPDAVVAPGRCAANGDGSGLVVRAQHLGGWSSVASERIAHLPMRPPGSPLGQRCLRRPSFIETSWPLNQLTLAPADEPRKLLISGPHNRPRKEYSRIRTGPAARILGPSPHATNGATPRHEARGGGYWF